jgi:hypothetical protein
MPTMYPNNAFRSNIHTLIDDNESSSDIALVSEGATTRFLAPSTLIGKRPPSPSWDSTEPQRDPIRPRRSLTPCSLPSPGLSPRLTFGTSDVESPCLTTQIVDAPSCEQPSPALTSCSLTGSTLAGSPYQSSSKLLSNSPPPRLFPAVWDAEDEYEDAEEISDAAQLEHAPAKLAPPASAPPFPVSSALQTEPVSIIHVSAQLTLSDEYVPPCYYSSSTSSILTLELTH